MPSTTTFSQCLIVVALVTLAVPVSAVITPDETPRERSEWGFRPFDGKVSPTDPPGFVWRPQENAQTYALRVATDEACTVVIYEVDGIELTCHCPPAIFGPGEYFWQFRFTTTDGETSAWSSVRSFTIDDSSRPFPMPAREDLLARIPQGHPRLLFRADDIPRLRDLAEGESATEKTARQWRFVKRECEEVLAGKGHWVKYGQEEITEPKKHAEGLTRAEWWPFVSANFKYTRDIGRAASSLAFAYTITGDDRYAQEARRLVLAVCAWDPRGATGYLYNDSAGMQFAKYIPRAYTWLYDYFTEAEREKIRAVMQVRGQEMYDYLNTRHQRIWNPYSSHSNRAYHYLAEIGTAFYGEVQGAGDWVWFAMNYFYNVYPVWSDEAGGWHEGMSYWSSYMDYVLPWLTTMQSVYRLDPYAKPFFSNAGNFPLYVTPPGSKTGGFGDLTLSLSGSSARSTMNVFARMSGNPYWQWYANNHSGNEFPKSYMGFIAAALPPVAARAPTDLPSSILFPGVGVASLHNDLVNRESDVQLLFKSSPFGSGSHGYESQNTFLLNVAGYPIFIRSGKRDTWGSPHQTQWMWQTKSVNNILVNGQGQQKVFREVVGEITGFHTSPQFDYVVGEAGSCYEERLNRFTRAVLFIKPQTIVMFDALEAPQPSTFQWLLHSLEEMQIDGQTITATNTKGGVRAVVRLLRPRRLRITQTNECVPPSTKAPELDHSHLQASTTQPQREMDFISVIRAVRPGDPEPPLPATAMTSPAALGCTVELPAGRAIVVWRRSGDQPVSYGDLTTDGEVACVVLDAQGEVCSSFVHRGQYVTYKGQG